ncbi:MAG: hypothetical protein IJ249_02915 [Paludibacteraceae bacterium]|nr:hypothetical protein [Paludibacteraceae bacterium]
MKKNVLILSALCFAAMTLVFSGCKKENNDPQEPAKVQTYQMSIQASKGTDSQANGPRRVIGLGTDGETLTATWQTGDVVSVFNTTSYEQLDGQLTAQSNGVNTLLTGTLSGTVNVGDNLLLSYKTRNNANYANQNGTLEYISDKCDYATARVTVATVNGGVITTDADATFANQQAIVKFTLVNKADDAELNATKLVVKVGSETYTVTPASATSEMYVAIPLYPYPEPQQVTLTATVGGNTYTLVKTNVSLANGKFYQITAQMSQRGAAAPNEPLSGEFSVGASKKIHFSPGNLQYTRTSTSADWSTGTFSFMANQYDYVEIKGECNYDNETVIGLFSWATSGLNTPKSNTNHNPWENTDVYEGVGVTSSAFGSGIDGTKEVNWSDNNNEYANYDWGTAMSGGWRTLTKDEWAYIITGRDNAANLRTFATVKGTQGLILMPDGWTANGVSLTVTTSDYSTNTISSTADWATLVAQGCVFLPAAEERAYGELSNTNQGGCYWTSTSKTILGSTDNFFAYHITFSTSEGVHTGTDCYTDRCVGNSVRLVKDAD